MDKIQEYREKLEGQLKEWKEKIAVLEEKAATATGETKAEMLHIINELRQKKGVVKERWDALQKESGIAFDKMKDGVEHAAADLKDALDKVLARFK